MSVHDNCKCGHKRLHHNVVVRPVDGKLGSQAMYPYSDRYNHRCRLCKCDCFANSLTSEGDKDAK